MCQSLFFNKVAGLRTATSLKKRHWHRCFPVHFVKYLKTPFSKNTSGRLFFKSYSKLQWKEITHFLSFNFLSINVQIGTLLDSSLYFFFFKKKMKHRPILFSFFIRELKKRYALHEFSIKENRMIKFFMLRYEMQFLEMLKLLLIFYSKNHITCWLYIWRYS